MRILWLHQYFATPRGWGAVRGYEFVRRFAEAGHEVEVVCGAGFDASLKDGARVAEGVRVRVCGAAYHTRMRFAGKMFSFLRFMFFATGFVVRHGGRFEVIVVTSTPLTIAIPALAARLLHRARYVFEVRDVWPDAAISAGVLKNPVAKWLAFKLEKCAYQYASAIVTCSTGMTERVEAKLRKWKWTRRVETISNCCDLDLFRFPPDADERCAWRGKGRATPRDVVALYTGAMGLSNAIGDIVEAVKATGEGVVWWFAGDGRFAEELKALAASRSNVVFWGGMSKTKVARLYAAADVNVVTFMHAPLFYENSPNKFFDGIAAGLPAVFNRTTWLEPWLREYDCGFVCASPAEMAARLQAIAAMLAPARDAMRHRARRLAEEVFNRDTLAIKYVDVLASCLTETERNALKSSVLKK